MFSDASPTEIYPLSLHDALPIFGETVDPVAELESFPFAEVRLVLVTPLRHPLSRHRKIAFREALDREFVGFAAGSRSEEHTSELQSLAYLVCCLLLEKKTVTLPS